MIVILYDLRNFCALADATWLSVQNYPSDLSKSAPIAQNAPSTAARRYSLSCPQPPPRSLATMSNPYTPGSAGMPPGGAVPPELAKKAGNLQLMGILSIVIGLCCCWPAGLILAAIVLSQAGGVVASLAQYGSPPDLVGKVNTGKICAIVGIVVSCIGAIASVISVMGQLANQ